MSRIQELAARVKLLSDSHLILKSQKAALEQEKIELLAKIAELTAEAIAADALMVETMATVDVALDSGASMGGVL